MGVTKKDINDVSKLIVEQEANPVYDAKGKAITNVVTNLNDGKSVVNMSLLYNANLAKADLITSKNLFNKLTVTEGSFVDPTSGNLSLASGWVSSDFISVSPGLQFYKSNSGNSYAAFYDFSKVYISGVVNLDNNFLYTIPENAYYIRITLLDLTYLNTTQFELGVVESEYVPYIQEIPYGQLPKTINETISTKADLIISKNLFNKLTATEGSFINSSSGLPVSYGAFSYSDYIPVEELTNYYWSNAGNGYCAFYDTNKVYISGVSFDYTEGIEYVTPSLAKFIRLTVVTTSLNTAQFELGVDATEYAPYRHSIPSWQIDINSLSGMKQTYATRGSKFLVFGDSITESPSWCGHILALTDAESIRNFAKSGASYRDRYLGNTVVAGDDGIDYDLQDCSGQIGYALAKLDLETPNIVVISLGTNDGLINVGNYTTAMTKMTLESLDRTLLFEAMRWSFWTLRTNFPNAKFYAMTPIQRADLELEAIQSLDDAIIKMAKRYNFIIIDTRNESGIVKDFEIWGGAGLFLKDGLHPYNSEPFTGDKMIAKTVVSKVLSTHINS